MLDYHSKRDRGKFSVPHASRDPEILIDRNLRNENIFDLIKNPPEMGVVRIFENPDSGSGTRPKAKSKHLQHKE